jgi:drug/metabolite transporter (DMT)-like permease
MSSTAVTLSVPPARDVARPLLASSRSSVQNAPLKGIALIVGSTVFFSVSDVLTKLLTETLPAVEVAWLRYVAFVLLVLPAVLLNGGGSLLRSHRPGLQALRGLGTVGSAVLFTASLPYLPVADATAIYFISPILITALSIPFLGEAVGWRRWTAALIALIGVVIVIRPGTSAFDSAALLPLLGATSWAGAAVVTRLISGRDHPVTTLFYSALSGLLVLTAMLPFAWVTPGWREIGLGFAVGLFSTIGHALVVLGFRCANASTVAPFSYAQLVFAGFLGFAVFGTRPDSWTILGALVIAVSGLYTAYRERVRAREAARA